MKTVLDKQLAAAQAKVGQLKSLAELIEAAHAFAIRASHTSVCRVTPNQPETCTCGKARLVKAVGRWL